MPRHLGERKRERVVRGLRSPADAEEAALPAADARLVAHEEVDEDRHARLLPHAQGTLPDELRLRRVGDAEEAVGGIRLVAVLREPQRLRAEVARHVGADRRQARHREAVRARGVKRRLTATDGVRVLRVRVETCVSRMHPLHEGER